MSSRQPCVRIHLVVVLTGALLWLAGPSHSQAAVPAGSPLAAPSSTRQSQAQPPPKVYLPLVLKSFTPPQPSSFAKIADALVAGQIDADTALLYQVYATFKDPLLPAAYRGDDSGDGVEGNVAIDQLINRWLELKPATQQALSPFIQPPAYVGSWYDRRHFPQAQSQATVNLGPQDEPAVPEVRRPGWAYHDTNNGKVRVWLDALNHPEDETIALTVASLMNDKVWPEETRLLGRTPISDEGEHRFTDPEGKKHVWGDGGNGRLDIYLVPCDRCGGALTVAYPPGCTDRPALILIDPTVPVDRLTLEAATAHEFMHVLQFSYRRPMDCSEYDWFDEASAQWAIDFVFPDNQYEYYSDVRFLWPKNPLKRDVYAGYDEYPFFVYLTRTYNTGIIKSMLSHMELDYSLPAINVALAPGGLKHYWPEFALNLWNRPPVDFFAQRDDADKVAYAHPLKEYPGGQSPTDYTVEVKLEGQRAVQYVLPITLPALSMRYFHFNFLDPSARSVEYSNLYVPGFPDPNVKVQALLKVKGQDWVVQDWSEARRKGFCRDVAAERLEELVLIYSNAQWHDEEAILKPPVLPKLTVSNVGCYQWRGTISATHVRVAAPRTETSNGTVLFERLASPGNESVNPYYDLKQGQVHVEQTGTDKQGCRLQMAPLDQTLVTEDGDLVVASMPGSDLSDVGMFSGIAGAHDYRTLTYICDGGSYTNLETSQPTFRTDIFNPIYVAQDGDSIDGTVVIGPGSTGWNSTYTFHFDALAQP